MAEELGIVAGRYRLLSVLGEGGMGIVYRAEQLDPTGEPMRDVALKMLGPALRDPEFSRRFMREVRITARIDSPNTVRIAPAPPRPATPAEPVRRAARKTPQLPRGAAPAAPLRRSGLRWLTGVLGLFVLAVPLVLSQKSEAVFVWSAANGVKPVFDAFLAGEKPCRAT